METKPLSVVDTTEYYEEVLETDSFYIVLHKELEGYNIPKRYSLFSVPKVEVELSGDNTWNYDTYHPYGNKNWCFYETEQETREVLSFLLKNLG